MTRQSRRLAFLALAIALSAGSVPAADVVTWNVDGQTRRAIVYAPSGKSTAREMPLIFSFHGRGDDIQNFQHTDMHRAWPEAIVVYFQGLPSERGGFSGWQTEKGQDNDRDLKLVDAALRSLDERLRIDHARIYATGFSNGAAFTYLLWAERASVFAAYAPVAARLRPSVQLKQPKPVLQVAGRTDLQIPFADQQTAIEAAMRADGVSGKGASCGSGCTIYGSGSPAPVMTWIHPGGHEYPEGTSERIAKFFSAYALSSGGK